MEKAGFIPNYIGKLRHLRKKLILMQIENGLFMV